MRRLALSAVLAATIALSGCAATPAIETDTAERLQQTVLTVSDSAAAGDLAGALASLDAVVTELEAARVRGEVSEDRYARISAAVESLRAYLVGQTVPPPAPADDDDEAPSNESVAPPAEPAPPAEEPVEEDGDEAPEPTEPESTPTPSAPVTPAPTKTPAPGGGATPKPTPTTPSA